MEEGHGGLYALVWGEPVLPKRSTYLLQRPLPQKRCSVLQTGVAFAAKPPHNFEAALVDRASILAGVHQGADGRRVARSVNFAVWKLSPAVLAEQSFDWLAHLVISPGKQLQLIPQPDPKE
jgi:hypothetical protein